MAGFDVPAATERLRFGIWQDNDAALAEAIWADPEVTSSGCKTTYTNLH